MKREDIEKLGIDKSESILHAIRQMDDVDSKLLIVTDNGKYFRLISIGDIQRSIIKNVSLSEPIEKILRNEVVVASIHDSVDKVKAEIIKHRAEYMPVIDDNKELVNVYFWEDVISQSEALLKEMLDLPVVIMAGGKGTRLKPLTNIIPKALVPIDERPIIEVIIDRFVSLGVKDFFITVNHKSDMIGQYFDSIEDKKYNIKFIKEEKPLGTAGSLSLLKGELQKTFFVSNCDILIDQDYRDVYNYHKTNQNTLTIVAALKHYDIPYGTLNTLEGGILQSLQEKPELTFMVNSGMYILEAETLDLIPKNEFFHITHLIEKIQNNDMRVGVFPVSERSWLDIGNWSEYNKTQEIFKQKFS